MSSLSVAILTSCLHETFIALLNAFATLQFHFTSTVSRCRDNPLVPLSCLRVLRRINGLRLLELGMRLRILNLLILLHVSSLHLLS